MQTYNIHSFSHELLRDSAGWVIVTICREDWPLGGNLPGPYHGMRHMLHGGTLKTVIPWTEQQTKVIQVNVHPRIVYDVPISIHIGKSNNHEFYVPSFCSIFHVPLSIQCSYFFICQVPPAKSEHQNIWRFPSSKSWYPQVTIGFNIFQN